MLNRSTRGLFLLPGQVAGDQSLAHIAQPRPPEPARFAAGGQVGGVDGVLLLAVDILLYITDHRRIGNPSEGTAQRSDAD